MANPATAIASRVADRTGRPAWCTATETIPVAMTIANQPKRADPTASASNDEPVLVELRLIGSCVVRALASGWNASLPGLIGSWVVRAPACGLIAGLPGPISSCAVRALGCGLIAGLADWGGSPGGLFCLNTIFQIYIETRY